MTTVAVTGAGRYVAGAVLARLHADPAVTRLIGVDTVEPPVPPPSLEFRSVDVRDPLLAVALDGAEVVVHLGTTPGPQQVEQTMFAVNVHGTRNVLEAVSAVGARRLVHLSSGTVYGAHPDNPVPLTEDAPLRANHDFSWAYHHRLVEELIIEWSAAHPDVAVAVLRPTTTLGPRMSNYVTRHLEQLCLPFVRGVEPPFQLLGIDDLAAAIGLAATGDLQGPYNVAADGWLSAGELSHLTGRPRLRLGEAVAFTTARQLWRRRLVDAPPGALHYLMHPWVLSTQRLRDAGWVPRASNRDVVVAFVEEHRGYASLGRFRFQLRHAAAAAAAVATVSCAGLLRAGLAWRRARSA